MKRQSKRDKDAPLTRPIREGIERLRALLSAIASEDVAAVVTALASLSADELRLDIDFSAIAFSAGLSNDHDIAYSNFYRIDNLLRQMLDLPLLEESAGRRDRRLELATTAPSDVPTAPPSSMRLSAPIIELLTPPSGKDTNADEVPIVDDRTIIWRDAIRDASRAGARLHLALRCRRDDAREFEDFEGLLRRAAIPVHRISGPSGNVLTKLLRATLHKSADTVVLIEPSCLVFASPSDDGTAACWDEPDASKRQSHGWHAASLIADASRWIDKLDGVHVWRIPADASIPSELKGIVGGCIGPIRYDRTWRRGLVRRSLKGLSDFGADALLATAGDPRDLGAMAAAVEALAHDDRSPDEAAVLVASSMSSEPIENAATMPPPRNFDRRLLVCDEEALILLDRAAQAAKDGTRVLCWGGPGGGKSTYVQALAAQMATESKPKRDVILITPGLILARGLGATERIMEAIWARAASTGSIIIVDELDALCGVRDPGGSGSSSGNAYLVRTLTDQWLRCFDLHPSVTVLATCNALAAVDQAVRRRFALGFEFGDGLPPDKERLAWTVIAGMKPPAGWQPCGAAVADIAAAAASCRTLGTNDPASFATAVRRARLARLGRANVATTRRREPQSLH